jgi:hypothetical protein
MWSEIEIILYAFSCCTLLITTYIASFKRVPDGYQEIGGGLVRNNTTLLKWIAQIVSGAEFIIFMAFDLNWKEFSPVQWILPSTWFLLLCSSQYTFEIPYQGGLYGNFLAIFLLICGMMLSLIVDFRVPFLYATALAGVLWILVGSWYHEQVDNVNLTEIDVPRVY